MWLSPAVAPLVAELIMGNFLTSLPLLGVYSWVEGHMVAIELPKDQYVMHFCLDVRSRAPLMLVVVPNLG